MFDSSLLVQIHWLNSLLYSTLLYICVVNVDVYRFHFSPLLYQLSTNSDSLHLKCKCIYLTLHLLPFSPALITFKSSCANCMTHRKYSSITYNTYKFLLFFIFSLSYQKRKRNKIGKRREKRNKCHKTRKMQMEKYFNLNSQLNNSTIAAIVERFSQRFNRIAPIFPKHSLLFTLLVCSIFLPVSA